MADEYSPFTFTGDDDEDTFTPAFEWISTDHVYVYLDDVLQVAGTDYNWGFSNTAVIFVVVPDVGEIVVIKRATPRVSPLVDYDTAYVTDENLDDSTRQGFYVMNELRYELLEDREDWTPTQLATTSDQTGMYPGDTTTKVLITELSGYTNVLFDSNKLWELVLRIRGGVDVQSLHIHVGANGTVADTIVASSYATVNNDGTHNGTICALIVSPDADDIITCSVTFSGDTVNDEIHGHATEAESSFMVRRAT